MTPAPTLLVTTAEGLVEEVSSLASASGVAVAVVATAAAAGAAWQSAPLVLLGEDALDAPVPARRPGVLVLSTAGPAGDELWRSALAAGAEQVLGVPEESAALLRRLGEVAEASGDGGGRCVAVMTARGGVGGSTLAAALAWRAGGPGAGEGRADAPPTLLVDTDLLGGGLDLLVGLEDAPGLRWGDLSRARGSVRGDVLARSLPRRGSMSVLSSGGPGPSEALRGDVVTAVLRGARRHHGAVVLDVSRRGDPATDAALAAADVLLLLVPADVGSVVAARRVLEAVDPVVADVRLVLRRGVGAGEAGRRGGETGLPAAVVVDALGRPFAGTVDHDRGLAPLLARGEVPGSARRGALATACDALGELVMPHGGSW